jgi:protein DEK
MKTIKSILIAATLISASAVSTLSAQQAAQPAKEHQWKVAIGDSVMIKRECQEYLTGEKPSTWVYDKVHTVRQLGTKRFPEGVLLMNIYSWICEECLIPVSEKQEQEQPAKQDQTPAKQDQTPAKQDQTPAKQDQVTPAKQDQVTPAETTPVKQDQVAPADTTATQTSPVKQDQVTPADTTPFDSGKADTTATQPVKDDQQQQQQQAAIGDSIKSVQQFKGHYDRFSIGVRGGASGLLHNTVVGNWTCGFDALLDLQYAHYWTKDGRPVDLGLIVGLGVGYAQSGMKAAVNTDTTVVDNDGSKIDYKVKADEVKEHDGQIQLEVPIMFSLIHQNGLFFNIGPKFMIPVYTPYTQKISDNANTYISAYFQDIDVQIKNEVITGKLAETDYTTKGTDNGNQFSINVMLTAEIGYEWILKSGNSLGLGAFANYCVYNSFKNNATSTDPLVQVTPPTTGVASVEVLSATKTYATGLGFFDAGVKLAYHFNFPKKRKNVDAQLFE